MIHSLLNNRNFVFGLAWLLGFFVLSGCLSCNLLKLRSDAKDEGDRGTNLLQNNLIQADGVGVEVFIVRIPPQNQELLQQLWQDVNEQILPPAKRWELMDQGIRVGIHGSFLSPSLTRLINVASKTSEQHGLESGAGMPEISVAEIPKDPMVRRQYRNLVPGMRALFKVYDDPLPEMSLFWSENGSPCGKTYKNAQVLLSLTAKPQGNGSVLFEIIPELEYGTPVTNFRVQSGMTYLESGKPRRVFEQLAVSLNLIVGDWLILGPVSANCSGIGKSLFIRDLNETEHKMIVLRLMRARSDRPEAVSTTPAPEHVPIPERN